MDIDLLIFFGVLLALFILLLMFVKNFPIYLAKNRAKQFGIILSKEEASIVQKSFCIKKEFFQGAKDILQLKQIPIENLTGHFLAGGNFDNIKNGMQELIKRKKDVDFAILSAIDLTGKDLKTEIQKAETVESIEILELKNDNIEITYKANYKYSFPNSVWLDKSNENTISKVKDKLNTFLKGWEETDVFKTESFIRENILSIGFWESELKGILINQEFRISNNKR